MRKIGNIQEGDEIVGTRHRARVVKNKVAAPFKTVEFDMLAASGISMAGGIIDVATDLEIVQKAGSFYKYKDETLAQGRQNVIALLEEDEKLLKTIRDEVWSKVRSNKDKSKDAKTDKKAEK